MKKIKSKWSIILIVLVILSSIIGVPVGETKEQNQLKELITTKDFKPIIFYLNMENEMILYAERIRYGTEEEKKAKDTHYLIITNQDTYFFHLVNHKITSAQATIK